MTNLGFLRIEICLTALDPIGQWRFEELMLLYKSK